MTHVLYAAKDHDSLQRPGKHKLGQLVNIVDNFQGWGRREIPERGYGSIEVTDAQKWQVMPFMAPLLNFPHYTWSVKGNHMRAEAIFPPWFSLKDHEEWLVRQWFPNTLAGSSAYGFAVDCFTEWQAANLEKYANDRINDQLYSQEGPKYVLSPHAIQTIAWDGGFGTCGFDEFKRHMTDRTIQAMELAA